MIWRRWRTRTKNIILRHANDTWRVPWTVTRNCKTIRRIVFKSSKTVPVILYFEQLAETSNVLNKHNAGRDREARNLRNTEAVLRAFEQN